MTRPDETLRSRKTERILFVTALCLNLLIHVWLIGGDRMIQGHDTFVAYTMQSYSAANGAEAGEPPHESPYLERHSRQLLRAHHRGWDSHRTVADYDSRELHRMVAARLFA